VQAVYRKHKVGRSDGYDALGEIFVFDGSHWTGPRNAVTTIVWGRLPFAVDLRHVVDPAGGIEAVCRSLGDRYIVCETLSSPEAVSNCAFTASRGAHRPQPTSTHSSRSFGTQASTMFETPALQSRSKDSWPILGSIR
jgi:hypothetical protein